MSIEYGIVPVDGERFLSIPAGIAALARAGEGISMVLDIPRWRLYAAAVGFHAACVAPLIMRGGDTRLPMNADCASGVEEWQWILDHSDTQGPLLPATGMVQLLLTGGGSQVSGPTPQHGLGQTGNAVEDDGNQRGKRGTTTTTNNKGRQTGDYLSGLTQVRFTAPLRLGEDVRVVRAHDVVAVVSGAPAGLTSVAGGSSLASSGKEKTHAHGILHRKIPSTAANVLAQADLTQCFEEGQTDVIYEQLAAGGFAYGPSFRLLAKAWVGGGWACGLVRDSHEIAAVLDACMHPCGLLAKAASGGYPVSASAVALRCPQSHNPTHPGARGGGAARVVLAAAGLDIKEGEGGEEGEDDSTSYWQVVVRRHPDDAALSDLEAAFDVLATHATKPAMMLEGVRMMVVGDGVMDNEGNSASSSSAAGPKLYRSEWVDFAGSAAADGGDGEAVRDIASLTELGDCTEYPSEAKEEAKEQGGALVKSPTACPPHNVRLVLGKANAAAVLSSLNDDGSHAQTQLPPGLRRVVALASPAKDGEGDSVCSLRPPSTIDLVSEVVRKQNGDDAWQCLRWREAGRGDEGNDAAASPSSQTSSADDHSHSHHPHSPFRVTIDPISLEPSFHAILAQNDEDVDTVVNVDADADAEAGAAVEPTTAEASLAADEIELTVKAYGMNFLDVLAATHVLPPENFGGECVGIVRRCGDDVTHVKVGDRAAAILMGGFASRITVKAAFAAALPDGISFEAAATIPVAYATGWLALHWMARVRAGETALLHNAAGGVGLACVNLLRDVGARVLATCAPQPKKHEVLTAAGVEAGNIFNSRDAASWAGERRADVVVGALFGESLARSFDAANSFGRVVDIGKREQTEGGTLRLAPFIRGLSYSAAHLDELMKSDPESMQRLHGEVWAALGKSVHPLPLTSFPVTRLGDALRHLSAGSHTGKVVVIFENYDATGATDATDATDARNATDASNADASMVAAAVVAVAEDTKHDAAAVAPTTIKLVVDEATDMADRVESRFTSALSLLALSPLGSLGDVGDDGHDGPAGDAATSPVILQVGPPRIWTTAVQSSSETHGAKRSAEAQVRARSHSEVHVLEVDGGAVSAMPMADLVDALRETMSEPGRYRLTTTPPQFLVGGGDEHALASSQDAEVGWLAEAISHKMHGRRSGEVDSETGETKAVDIDNLTLEDLGLDSLARLQLMHGLRQKFPNTVLDLTAATSLASLRQSQEEDKEAVPGIPGARLGGGGRWLALHGFRTNGSILRTQLAGCGLDLLGGDVNCLDAPHRAHGPGPWDVEDTAVVPERGTGTAGAAVVAEAAEAVEAADAATFYEWWWSSDAARCATYEDGWRGDLGLAASMDFVRRHVRDAESRGAPYVGVVGFSQGASIAHQLVASGDVPCGLLFSPVAPESAPVGEAREGGEGKDGGGGAAWDYTTQHVTVCLDRRDRPAQEYVEMMMQQAAAPVFVEHSGLHSVPRRDTEGAAWYQSLERAVGDMAP